ncbi:MAG: Thermostable carboxypeptidase 1 [uncultured Rubrobacteraceae bacterium]|uniref:Metal-dependent carboxypeptidase n=1 Tax=uncultured Rubrobacteraceae bacterium TaxID=349277 RepID=A0A6J4PJ08_9ACTN|nr:MAG: Thermostable carboxypeptidase 1 [uncultured Rubrobacteraceae bacterium]
MEERLGRLGERLAEVSDLRGAAMVLYWDQATYMPVGGAAARGRQLGVLRRLAHEKFTDPAVGELLEGLRTYEEGLPRDSDEAALIRVTRREYEREARMPAGFVEEMSNHASASYAAWKEARPADDFEAMRPYLEKTLRLSRRYSAFFEGHEHVADPLIDGSDPGMTAASVGAVFSELRGRLVPLMTEVCDSPPADDSCLRGEFGDAEELAFAAEVARRLGYDFRRGRQDLTAHPFAAKLATGDVRITTRIKEDDVRNPLFSTLHEAGHGMYEQGVADRLGGTPLSRGASMGLHESQSRLWENLVGRSRPFWEFFYPKLQKVFPARLGSVGGEEFYRAINKVERSPIRTDADEVTYNLHVILRFDFELEMLEGKLEVRDLPEAWRERMREDLGLTPPDDRAGVLQDAHWFNGAVGGRFQGYTLGNIMSAQFYGAALEAHPEIPSEIRTGEFGTLHGWLSRNIYRHGKKFTAAEILQNATGSRIDVGPYMDYLRSKYGELYGV